MTRHRKKKQRVRASRHASGRGELRADMDMQRLEKVATAALKEQLRRGLKVERGCAVLKLDGQRLGLDKDLKVPLSLPDTEGTWTAVTVLEDEKGEGCR